MSDDKKYFTIDPSNWTLPAGHSGYHYNGYGWSGYNVEYGTTEEKKCECGAWITYGKECPPEFHAPTYCPIYKKPEGK